MTCVDLPQKSADAPEINTNFLMDEHGAGGFPGRLERAERVDLPVDLVRAGLAGVVAEQHGSVGDHDQRVEPPALDVGGAPYVEEVQPEAALAAPVLAARSGTGSRGTRSAPRCTGGCRRRACRTARPDGARAAPRCRGRESASRWGRPPGRTRASGSSDVGVCSATMRCTAAWASSKLAKPAGVSVLPRGSMEPHAASRTHRASETGRRRVMLSLWNVAAHRVLTRVKLRPAPGAPPRP